MRLGQNCCILNKIELMNKFISIDPQKQSTYEIHKILLSSVAPRPIALASTIDIDGNINLSPFSYFNVFSANPPILIFSPANRISNNTTKDTLDNVKQVKEVVINLVDFDIVEPTSLSSVEYKKNIDEFLKSGLSKINSTKIFPPRVKESPVSFECRVNDIVSLGNSGGAGNLIICEILLIHINKKYLNDKGEIDPLKLKLVARMGGNYYLKSSIENVFKITKPVGTKAIGLDKLPKHIQNSKVLTKNQLARLANIEKIPNDRNIRKHINEFSLEKIISSSNDHEKINLIHAKVKKFLEKNNFDKAVLTTFSIK